jgi:hypothetical protein
MYTTSSSVNYNDTIFDTTASYECEDIDELIPPEMDHTRGVGVRIVFGTLYSLIFIIGLILNSAVILAVIRNRRLQSARNMFLLNLMISDIILCLTSVPITPIAVVTKRWIFGSILCRALPLIQSVAVMVTSWSLTVIALDKYIHIMDPTQEAVTLKTAAIITILLWTFNTAVNIPYVISFTLEDGQEKFKSEKNPNGICGEFCDETWDLPGGQQIYGKCCTKFIFNA